MMNAVDVYALPPEQNKLRAYMLNYFDDDGDFQHLPDAGRQAEKDWPRRQLWMTSRQMTATSTAAASRWRRAATARLAGQQDQHWRLPHCPKAVQI